MNVPDALLPSVAHPRARRIAQRQRDAELVLFLGVLENHHVLLDAPVHLKAPEDAHFRQQALHKRQIRFAPLGDQLACRVLTRQAKLKVRPLKASLQREIGLNDFSAKA